MTTNCVERKKKLTTNFLFQKEYLIPRDKLFNYDNHFSPNPPKKMFERPKIEDVHKLHHDMQLEL